MTILVHQLFSVPLNVMMVWIRPRMSIPIKVPGTKSDPAGEQGSTNHHAGDSIQLQTHK